MMLASIILQASPTDTLYNSVYDLYSYLGWATGIVVTAFIAYICIRYRSRRGLEVSPEKQRENRDTLKGPIIVMLLMAIVLTGVTVPSFIALHTFSAVPASSNKIEIRVVAHQWAWTFIYPNNFQSEDLAVVPINTLVVFNVTSIDVYHQFGISYFRVKTDAIAGRYNVLWIKPVAAGNYTVQCYELCGIGHSGMIGTLAVVSQSSFNNWYTTAAAGRGT